MTHKNNKIDKNKTKNNDILNSTNDIQYDIEKNQLKIDIEKVRNKIIDKKLRLQAKIENINKQTIIEINKIKTNQLQLFLKKIITIIDKLENLLKNVDKNNVKNNSIIKGIDLTLQYLVNTTKKFGLRKEGKINTFFNTNFHTLNTYRKTDSNTRISSIIKYGYIFNNYVLRKAIVETTNE